jgi:hypothetical protein
MTHQWVGHRSLISSPTIELERLTQPASNADHTIGRRRWAPDDSRNGKCDLTVVANFVMSAADVTGWERGLKKASELFWDAFEGRIQFGRIFVSDDSVGIDSAVGRAKGAARSIGPLGEWGDVAGTGGHEPNDAAGSE